MLFLLYQSLFGQNGSSPWWIHGSCLSLGHSTFCKTKCGERMQVHCCICVAGCYWCTIASNIYFRFIIFVLVTCHDCKLLVQNELCIIAKVQVGRVNGYNVLGVITIGGFTRGYIWASCQRVLPTSLSTAMSRFWTRYREYLHWLWVRLNLWLMLG